MSTNDFQPDPYVPPYSAGSRARALRGLETSARRNFIKITGLAGGGLVLAMALGPDRAESARPGEAGRYDVRREPVRADQDRRHDRAVREESRGRAGREDVAADDRRGRARRGLEQGARRASRDRHQALRPASRGRLDLDADELGPVAPRRRDGTRDARNGGRTDLEGAGVRDHDREVGRRITARSNRSSSYGELASAAAALPVPERRLGATEDARRVQAARHARHGRRQPEDRDGPAAVRHRRSGCPACCSRASRRRRRSARA